MYDYYDDGLASAIMFMIIACVLMVLVFVGCTIVANHKSFNKTYEVLYVGKPGGANSIDGNFLLGSGSISSDSKIMITYKNDKGAIYNKFVPTNWVTYYMPKSLEHQKVVVRCTPQVFLAPASCNWSRPTLYVKSVKPQQNKGD